MKWYLKVLKQYADFSGRARRKEYWMFVLFDTIFAFALVLSGTFLGSIEGLIFLCAIYWLVTLIPRLAVTFRRLHDVGKSGWMILILLIPYVGGIWFFILLLLDSEPNENKYGQNPKILFI